MPGRGLHRLDARPRETPALAGLIVGCRAVARARLMPHARAVLHTRPDEPSPSLFRRWRNKLGLGEPPPLRARRPGPLSLYVWLSFPVIAGPEATLDDHRKTIILEKTAKRRTLDLPIRASVLAGQGRRIATSTTKNTCSKSNGRGNPAALQPFKRKMNYMTTQRTGKPAAARAGFIMSLVTNPAFFPDSRGKIPSCVGHPQLALHFTNRQVEPERLFRDRENLDGQKYPMVDVHLIIRVGRFSRKFDRWQENAVSLSSEVSKAQVGLLQAAERIKQLEAERTAHFSGLAGYADLLAACEAAERRVAELGEEREEKGYFNTKEKELLDLRREQAAGLGARRMALEKTNPWSKEEELAKLREQSHRLNSEIKRLRRESRSERNQREFLNAYLQENGIPHLPDRLFKLMLKRKIVLYALEPGNPPPATDRRGIPLAKRTVENLTAEGGTAAAVSYAPCDMELSIPWTDVFAGMQVNCADKLFVPGGGEKKFFVYAVRAPEDPDKANQTKHWDRLGTVVVGCFPTDDERGWAVILCRRHWLEVSKNLDLIRSQPIITYLLPFWPDASQQKLVSTPANEQPARTPPLAGRGESAQVAAAPAPPAEIGEGTTEPGESNVAPAPRTITDN